MYKILLFGCIYVYMQYGYYNVKYYSDILHNKVAAMLIHRQFGLHKQYERLQHFLRNILWIKGSLSLGLDSSTSAGTGLLFLQLPLGLNSLVEILCQEMFGFAALLCLHLISADLSAMSLNRADHKVHEKSLNKYNEQNINVNILQL